MRTADLVCLICLLAKRMVKFCAVQLAGVETKASEEQRSILKRGQVICACPVSEECLRKTRAVWKFL